MAISHLWQRAASFAARAHRHELRKDKRTPYFAHPVRVALTVACVFGIDDEEVLAAALLHDTIEDTGVDYDDVLDAFGKNVADYVAAMTKDMRLVEPMREPAYDQQLAAGPWQARLIKLADVYDNLHDGNGKSKSKMLEKAQRALQLSRGDAELAKARQIVTALVEQVRSQE